MPGKHYQRITTVARPAKPRESGLSMLIDWGLGVMRQGDLLEAAAETVDLAKVAVGISGLLPGEVLEAKLALYRKHGVLPFPGGQYLEYAVGHGLTDAYLESTREAGYTVIEVSDNTVPFSPGFKSSLIGRCVRDFGFTVLGEVGSKVASTDAESMVADIQNCLDAGAWKVFVEAADLFENSRLRTDLVGKLTKAIPLERLIFELPGWWLGELGVHKADTLKHLIGAFGPEVNLGNLEEPELFFTETLRHRTGTAGFQDS